AEIYHKDYYNSNKSQPYCSYIINPKMAEFKRVFKDKLAD
ncbi:MAG: peptide-methionine (S)-S-oxide reductase, partial [Cyclobacteriaceae bacterium]